MSSDKKESVAYLDSVKSSPLKVVRLTQNLVGMRASVAIMKLKFCKLKLAPLLVNLIYSAMSNAENNHNMDVDNLVVRKIDVGRAFVLKRFSARARGRSSRILKTFSKVRVVLVENK